MDFFFGGLMLPLEIAAAGADCEPMLGGPMEPVLAPPSSCVALSAIDYSYP
jgi:hypothetical protein